MQKDIKQFEKSLTTLLINKNEEAAFQLYNELKKFLDANQSLKEKNNKLYYQYKKYLLKFRFLSLSYTEDWQEISRLIEDHLELAFEMPEYDLWSHLKRNLIFISFLDVRAEVKSRFKKAVEKCNNRIIDKSKYNDLVPEKISEWIKEFIINVEDDGKLNNMKKANYLNNDKKYNVLDKQDKQKVLSLLNLYEALSQPSTEREGMEETPLMASEDGEVFILHDQGVDTLKPYLKKILNFQASRKGQESFIEQDTKKTADQGFINERQEKIKVLEKMLADYNENSLEAKALREEIKRLKVTNAE